MKAYQGMILAVLLAAAAGSAQTLPGLWGSPLYRVQLAVTGSSVTGTFTPVDGPQAPAGTISGEVQPGGQAFTANWAQVVGPDTVRFQTFLKLGARGSLLTGYRWTEETSPASFSLHRAVNGQVPVLVGQDDPAPTSTTTTTPPTTTPSNNPTANPQVEVITCESAPNGQPQNVSEQFTAPKTVCALVRYTNLPPNATVDWLWTLEGRTEAKLTKVLSGTGWHMHGLQSQTAIIPGAYQLTVSLNGQVVARRTVTVRAAAGVSTPTTPTTPTTPPSQPGAEVVVCESAANGVAQNPGSLFNKPKSLVCLVKYRAFPANAELRWVWIRNGAQIAEHKKTVSGTGWAYHGLQGAPTLTPGPYKVQVYAVGALMTTIALTVK